MVPVEEGRRHSPASGFSCRRNGEHSGSSLEILTPGGAPLPSPILSPELQLHVAREALASSELQSRHMARDCATLALGLSGR